MGHQRLREDKTCLNCDNPVEERFCTHCGQENIEPRHSFHYLFTHFLEDLVHYDGSFWRTMKTLFLRPGKLTREYLEGKRQSQVNPVRMYIFVSFIVFFVMSVFPAKEVVDTSRERLLDNPDPEIANHVIDSVYNDLQKNKVLTPEQVQEQRALAKKNADLFSGRDSLNIHDDEAPEYLKKVVTKINKVNRSKTKSELVKEIREQFMHILPKVLFVYLPIFAFMLWLVYSKKRWLYYDHGIFTLHYFSMSLLCFMLLSLLSDIGTYFPDSGFVSTIIGLITAITILYIIVYLFLGMHRVYRQKKRYTIIKGIFLIFTNLLIMSIIATGIIIYSFLNLK